GRGDVPRECARLGILPGTDTLLPADRHLVGDERENRRDTPAAARHPHPGLRRGAPAEKSRIRRTQAENDVTHKSHSEALYVRRIESCPQAWHRAWLLDPAA